MKNKHRNKSLHLTIVFMLFFTCLVYAQPDTETEDDNSTVVIVPMRLLLNAKVTPLTFELTKVFKVGEDRHRDVFYSEIPPGRSIVGWLDHVTEQMRNAGYGEFEEMEDEGGKKFRRYFDRAPVIAKITSTITLKGTGRVTQNFNVQATFERPPWPKIREQTQQQYFGEVSESKRREIRTQYKRWLGTELNHIDDAIANQLVRLSEENKNALRLPRSHTISQSRQIDITESLKRPLKVEVTSHLVNMRLGVN